MSAARNTWEFVREVIHQLKAVGISTYLFGGWAEELWQLSAPRTHADIDLLYPAADFQAVDRWLRETNNIIEIAEKRFHHKRAMLYHQVKLEFFLLEPTVDGYVTNYFGDGYRLYWPSDALTHLALVDGSLVPVASSQALQAYRQNHHHIQLAYQYYQDHH
ncbi:nucleotidyltransferase domain-containing protein [Dictyobacter aurantiacus]|uniref:Aminoglycoside nucleotidyltransferase n=1 Tax=Dictyobacter aurantiacus TaxID=1936993 RepID=A0A401ZS51_9CHLR|nr:hypothetical protein [Dictyobacter aurantiacus]GCE09632.1 hypothetical protein KDAU_69610 [Dictyobacter aurantiacus]